MMLASFALGMKQLAPDSLRRLQELSQSQEPSQTSLTCVNVPDCGLLEQGVQL